jgi:hypothetical protein
LRESQILVTTTVPPKGRQSETLWFEKVFARLRVGFWSGAIILSLIQAVMVLGGYSITSGGLSFEIVSLLDAPISIGYFVFLVFASKYISTRMEKLQTVTGQLLRIGKKDNVEGDDTAQGNANSLDDKNTAEFIGPMGLSRLIRPIYSPRGLLVSWAAVIAVSLILDFTFFPRDIPIHIILESEIFSLYLLFMVATFLWVFVSSMYSMYQIGKLPLNLKHYTEDRTLGLKPFGTTCLHIIAVYVVVILLSFPLFLDQSLPVVIGSTIFLALGLPFFLISLLSLRAKLIETKRERQKWITSRHSELVHKIERDPNILIDGGVANELVAIAQIEKDIQQIHQWPFDHATPGKLATIVMLPIAVTVLAEYLPRIFRVS